MIGVSTRIPVKKCWVKHDSYGLGMVLGSMEGVDGISLKVKWNDREVTDNIVALSAVTSGFKVGMEVKHTPISATETSLGEGVILKTRTVAGFAQVLVDFNSRAISRWLPYETLSWIKGVKHRFITGDRGKQGAEEKFRLKILAHALEIWNENTGALSRMDIDPLPHQIHLVHHILASGHLNWLIADDVGLGKTIETGMLLKALEQRGQAKRVLLITPAGLTNQWKEELHHKFALSEFRVYGENFFIDEDREWKMYDHVIGSIDKLKDEGHLEKLLRADTWDLVIFDEAHRLSRRQYGMRFDSSQRFDLANRLRQRTKAMVLLSATPHQGKQDKFQSLLMLLNPDRSSDIETIGLNPEVLSEMMIRNNKSDVTDAEGNFIFKGKTSTALTVESNDQMRVFDESLQAYLRQGYSAAESLGQTGNAIGFVMTVYRKLAASSAKAIHTALHRRKQRLIDEFNEENNNPLLEVTDERYWGEFEERLESSNREFFDGEMDLLDELIQESESVLGNDLKIKKFNEVVIPKILGSNPKEKVLIFTEYRSTQEYLKQALEEKYGDDCTGLINGSMRHQDRKTAIQHFEEGGQFLISTEAGGEGINLQRKCHIMVNYDLPWNPMRLVQRIGRLYRYGQQKRVVVFNLHSPDSADEQIMELMYERIGQVVEDLAQVSGEYNERLGEDILGEIADLADIESILQQATTEGIKRTTERIEEALNKAKGAASKQRELFEYAAAFDPNEQKKELNITSDHAMSFVEGMFELFGVEIIEKTHKDQVWHIRLPENIKLDLGVGKTRFEVTFDRFISINRENTEMMDLDNFIFKYLLFKAKDFDFDGLTAVIKSDQFTGDAIICSYLQWQNELGIRQRQELYAWQSGGEDEVIECFNELDEWLKEKAVPGSVDIVRDQNKIAYESVENVANKQLSLKSNKWLFPEGVHPVSAAWVDK
ncbi:DEAD/DEAH box helicase [Teredinibacter purpureus]|uniref:DEAD/DEAH box helicase n=1 Tax=Teredinibacter purpureus TaxID=2731756 RepID=UPI000A5B2A01|nr:helicase-related protein [Teredinibacter purpureus]